jgi:hypothetical protein
LAANRGLNEEVWRQVFEGVLNTVQIIAGDVLIEVETEAKARIASRERYIGKLLNVGAKHDSVLSSAAGPPGRGPSSKRRLRICSPRRRSDKCSARRPIPAEAGIELR